MRSINRYYRLEKRDIFYVKFILEAYDGIALMKTLDSYKGIIQFMVAPGREHEFNSLMHGLIKEVHMEQIDEFSL